MTRILGLVEHDRGKLSELSMQMLALGRRLASSLGEPLHAVLFGAEARPLADRLAAHGVSAVHVVSHERLTDYAPEAWAQSIVEIAGGAKPRAILAAATDRGSEVMAHVAARLDLPLAAQCTDVEPGDGLRVTRLRWGGSLLEEARLAAEVCLITVAPHAIAARETPDAAPVEIVEVTPSLIDKDFRVRVSRRIEAGGGAASLADARVVVGGGRGVGSAEGFQALEDLARLLNGAVGCSRAVTSLGWRPHADQIGQTGTRIAPDLYIACGISGAIQHMVGCQGAKRILAINVDADAPIVARADFAVIGDLHEVVPAVCEEIKKLPNA